MYSRHTFFVVVLPHALALLLFANAATWGINYVDMYFSAGGIT